MITLKIKEAFIIQKVLIRSTVTFFLRETLANKEDKKITDYK